MPNSIITTRRLQLELISDAAHEGYWPFIDLIINSTVMYSGEVCNKLLLDFDFNSLQKNTISIVYKNKRFGPDAWDTIVDAEGNIIKDQHILIKSIRIDECNLNFLITTNALKLDDGTSLDTNGYLSFNNTYSIDFEEPYYDWVQTTRESSSKFNKTVESSLPFITSYVYDHNNKIVADLLKKLQETVDAAKDFNYNNPVS